MLGSALEVALTLCGAIILANWTVELDTDVVTGRSSNAADIANN